MKIFAATVALSAALTACAGTSDPIYTPTGSIGYKIDCSGTARNWGECEAKAGEMCKASGYTVLSKTDERMPSFAEDTHISDMVSSRQVARSMTIQCNGPQTARN